MTQIKTLGKTRHKFKTHYVRSVRIVTRTLGGKRFAPPTAVVGNLVEEVITAPLAKKRSKSLLRNPKLTGTEYDEVNLAKNVTVVDTVADRIGPFSGGRNLCQVCPPESTVLDFSKRYYGMSGYCCPARPTVTVRKTRKFTRWHTLTRTSIRRRTVTYTVGLTGTSVINPLYLSYSLLFMTAERAQGPSLRRRGFQRSLFLSS